MKSTWLDSLHSEVFELFDNGFVETIALDQWPKKKSAAKRASFFDLLCWDGVTYATPTNDDMVKFTAMVASNYYTLDGFQPILTVNDE